MRHWLYSLLAVGPMACSAPSDAPTGADPSSAPALTLGALDAAPRTIPYGGYVDFDGEPVNAGAVGFNFVIFPCATPGTGAGGCSALWVAKGTWTNAATWTNGWPAGASDELDLPIFSGRFAVELGAAGQNPLPDAVFDTGGEPLYLGVRVEGRALGALQKIVPTTRTHTAALAESARVADMVGDLTPEEIASRRSWATSGEVAPGGTLELQTFGDATDAQVFLWERRGSTWAALDLEHSFLEDPSLQAYYTFDEPAGTVANDMSGKGRHLALSAIFTLGHPGVRGQSMRFGGSGASGGANAVNSTFGLALDRGLTISMWLDPREWRDDVYILYAGATSGNDDFLFHLYAPLCGAGRILHNGGRTATVCTGVGATQQRWTHVVMTIDERARRARWYVDGAQDAWASDTAASFAGRTLNYLKIGGHPTIPLDYIGFIDEVAIFDRALTADEVADLHRHGVSGVGYDVNRQADGKVSITNQTGTSRVLRVLVVK
ncbi:MAG: LamG domain-containing protein [Deltaproteobacteria bacterium]|nr:LamG domain-containing protein [Deltaproteobacteria bacterium]